MPAELHRLAYTTQPNALCAAACPPDLGHAALTAATAPGRSPALFSREWIFHFLRLAAPSLWSVGSRRPRQLSPNHHKITLASAFPALDPGIHAGAMTALARCREFFVHCPPPAEFRFFACRNRNRAPTPSSPLPSGAAPRLARARRPRASRFMFATMASRSATIPSVALHCASCCRFKRAAVIAHSVVLSVSIIVALRLLVESATLARDWLTKSCPAQLWAWRRYPGARWANSVGGAQAAVMQGRPQNINTVHRRQVPSTLVECELLQPARGDGELPASANVVSMMQDQRFYFHFSDLSRDVLELDWKGRPCETPQEAIAYAHTLASGLVCESSHRDFQIVEVDARPRLAVV